MKKKRKKEEEEEEEEVDEENGKKQKEMDKKKGSSKHNGDDSSKTPKKAAPGAPTNSADGHKTPHTKQSTTPPYTEQEKEEPLQRQSSDESDIDEFLRELTKKFGCKQREFDVNNTTRYFEATTLLRYSSHLRWSRKLNTKLLDAYYISTELDANRPHYMRRLELIWNSDPNNPVIDGNRLATRVRYIFKRKLYSKDEIEAIRKSVRSRLAKARSSTTGPSSNENKESHTVGTE
ncbi:hypothetical protein M8J77_016973 [Diaphorina citri]|nr:hypothetical protein M8J77_016973 [Diaphorina citri]